MPLNCQALAPCLLLALGAACAAPSLDDPGPIPPPALAEEASGQTGLGTQAQALGEPVTEGAQVFPNWQERVIHVLTNRARSDPAKQMAECTPGAYKACPWPEGVGCYSAKAPLVWDLATARAARFHATYLSKAPCALGHNTCCRLRADVAATGCDGDPACACEAGTQSCGCAGACGNPTNFGTRLSRFGVSGSGEIAHQYYDDPLTIFHGWIDEDLPSSDTPGCSMTGRNGHRWLVLTSNGPKAGAGYFKQASSCNSPYWVEDFSGGAATPSRVPGGVHYPRSGTSSTSFTFWANYYHPGGGAPSRAALVVDGACRPLTLEFGTVANGTFRLQTTLGSGCHPYYFLFVDSAGTRVTYPTTGSLTVGVGGATACAEDFQATRLSADCESSPSDAGMPPDAALPGPDAAQPGPDASQPRPDAAQPGPDASQPRPDAAQPGPDASLPRPDAAQPGPDASQTQPDAAQPGVDAAQPGLDAAQPEPDAAAPVDDDAGEDPADAAAPNDRDAASESPDAGAAPETVGAGCGCSAGGGAWSAPALAALVLLRRRARSACPAESQRTDSAG